MADRIVEVGRTVARPAKEKRLIEESQGRPDSAIADDAGAASG
jgi:hypothetical protein